MIPHEFNSGSQTPSGEHRYRNAVIMALNHRQQTCTGTHCKQKRQSMGQFITGSSLCAKCRVRAS